jgi:hypothetical protein
MNPLIQDELDLARFIERERLDAPAAFSRYWIELVPRPSDGDAPPPLSDPVHLRPSGEHDALLHAARPMLEYMCAVARSDHEMSAGACAGAPIAAFGPASG